MTPGPTRPTNEMGRHPLPTSRPRTKVQQSRAASATRGPSRTRAIAQSEVESVPVHQSAAMMRQPSKPYINWAASPPYRNEADANKDLEATITAVNRGRQPSNSVVNNEPLQQAPEAGDSSSPDQVVVRNGIAKTLQEWEVIDILTGWLIIKNANIKPPPASSETQLKRKRNGDEDNEEKKATKEKEKKHKCNTCGKMFYRNEHVERHAKSMHGKVRERFVCDVCGKHFSRKDNLGQHRKSTHPKAGRAPVPRSISVTVDENGKETEIAEGPVTLPAPEAAEPIDSLAQSGCEEVGDSESSSSHMSKCGRSTSTTSGLSSSKTTTGTGSKFNPINKPHYPIFTGLGLWGERKMSRLPSDPELA